jgi:tRNA threonylcarbamoyladenosine biosynthesis protein TsaE
VNGVAALTRSADQTRAVGHSIAQLLRPGDVIIVAGELGSGKTTFVQGVAAGLGVDATVVSPTFTLAREYAGRIPLVHVDVYRLDRGNEIIDLGLEELADDAVLAVEWGDVAAAYLPPEHLEVRMGPGPGPNGISERTIALATYGASWTERQDALTSAVGLR